MTKYVADWLARANDDILTIEALAREKGPPRIMCFHAQQAAEKLLKGFLASREVHVRKVHDLQELIDACKKLDQSFEQLRADARYLTKFYTEARYPTEIPDFTENDAREAHEALKRVQQFVTPRIEQNR